MPGRALSERVKRQKFRRTENIRYQEATDAYFREQQLPEGRQRRGLRPIAEQYNVKWRTLEAAEDSDEEDSESGDED